MLQGGSGERWTYRHHVSFKLLDGLVSRASRVISWSAMIFKCFGLLIRDASFTLHLLSCSLVKKPNCSIGIQPATHNWRKRCDTCCSTSMVSSRNLVYVAALQLWTCWETNQSLGYWFCTILKIWAYLYTYMIIHVFLRCVFEIIQHMRYVMCIYFHYFSINL